MKTAIYEEYKSAYSNIQTIDFDKTAHTLIIKAVDDVLTAAYITNNDGILALDDYANKLNKVKALSRFYKELLTMISNGVAPETIEEICLYKLVSYNFSAVETIAAIIYLLGVLDLQQGLSLANITTKLYALIPLEIIKILEINNEADRMNILFPEETLEEYLAEIKEKASPITPEDEEYFIVHSAEHTIEKLSISALQELLSNINNSDIGVALQGMSGKNVSKVLSNLSPTLAKMIIKDMKLMGKPNNGDIAAACHAILLASLQY